MIHTGLPRHSTTTFSPGWMAEMSTSTAAPAALARSEGWKVLTKGTATAAAPTPPMAQDVMSQVRRLLSTVESTVASLMGIFQGRFETDTRVNQALYRRRCTALALDGRDGRLMSRCTTPRRCRFFQAPGHRGPCDVPHCSSRQQNIPVASGAVRNHPYIGAI